MESLKPATAVAWQRTATAVALGARTLPVTGEQRSERPEIERSVR